MKLSFALVVAWIITLGCSGATGGAGGEGGDPLDHPEDACVSEQDCQPDEFCQLADYGCEDRFSPSRCAPRPTACPDAGPQPICGCDGNLYDNGCAAEAAGVNARLYSNNCTSPPGTFPCGWTFCVRGREICEERLEVSFQCVAYGPNCDPSAPTCEACYPEPEIDCVGSCEALDGEIFVNCE